MFAGRFALGAMQFDGTATRAVCVCVFVVMKISTWPLLERTVLVYQRGLF